MDACAPRSTTPGCAAAPALVGRRATEPPAADTVFTDGLIISGGALPPGVAGALPASGTACAGAALPELDPPASSPAARGRVAGVEPVAGETPAETDGTTSARLPLLPWIVFAGSGGATFRQDCWLSPVHASRDHNGINECG
eukprot:5509291-Prymnesium_polylepis.4